MSKTNPDPNTERSTYKLLWDMWNVLDDHDGYGRGNTHGTIISNYAHLIDGRIEGSPYSASTESLKLFTTQQLEDELKRRKNETN